MCRLFAKLTPGQRLAPSIDTSWISDDPADVKRYEEDPLIDKGKLRAATAITFLDAMHQVVAEEANLAVPLLCFCGDSDRITDVRGSKRLFEKCSSKDKTLEVVHTRTHEMLLHATHGPVLVEMAAEWILTRSSNGSKL